VSDSDSDSESLETVSRVQEVGREGGQHAQSSRPHDETERRDRGPRTK